MKKGDQYHRWVEWSDEDQTYLGKCPDILSGIHGDDPVQVYADLCVLIDEIIEYWETEGKPLPEPSYYPAQIALRKAA